MLKRYRFMLTKDNSELQQFFVYATNKSDAANMLRIYSEYKHFSYTYVSYTSKAYLGGRELRSYSSEEVVEIIKKQYDALYEIVARQEESKNVQNS